MPVRISFRITTLILTIFVIGLSYLALVFYARSAGRELLTSWARAEQIALQEGNYLSAIAKCQRMIGSSGLLAGVALFDLTNPDAVPLASFGRLFGPPRTPLAVDEFSSSRVGLFSFVETFRLSERDQIAVSFLIRPIRAIVAFAVGALSILLISLSSLFAIRYVERREAGARSEVIQLALRDLSNGAPPSEVLVKDHPFLVRRWEEMASAIESMKAIERVLASRNAMLEVSRQVAHDLASPLSALRLVSSSPRLRVVPEAEVIRSAVERLADISSKLPTKDEGGERRVNVAARRISPILKTILNEKRYEYSGRTDLEMEFTCDESVTAIVDEVEFGRILSNLINNSAEAMLDGGRIFIEVSTGGGRVAIDLTDSGPGFSSEILKAIKAGIKTTSKVVGSGLGLSHARAHCREWGGDLEVANIPGAGARVTLSLNC